MSDGLNRMPGHRSVADSAEQTDAVLELLPFLPSDYQAAVPLYISMALLFIVVSRAARRKTRTKLRKPPAKRAVKAAAAAAEPPRAVVGARRLRPHEGHWGDG